MPEESINIFISNIYAIAIFTGFFAAIFLVLFMVSRILINRSKKFEADWKEDNLQVKEMRQQERQQDSQTGSMMIVRKDIFIKKNLFISGLLFICAIFFIILILLSYLFATNFRMEGSFYIILSIIFLIIVMTVYIVKSKIIER